MNVIILAKNREKYSSGYYHQDIIDAFQERANCYLYGEGYPGYDEIDTIDDVMAKSPFAREGIDLAVVSTSWEREVPPTGDSDPHPRINLSQLGVPKVFLLNKEYKKLDEKLEYARRNDFDCVFTAHHGYQKWAAQTGLHLIQLPFASNPERFKDYRLPRKYDFGFTGALHRTHTDVRYRVKGALFRNPEIKSNQGIGRVFRGNPLRDEFRRYKIYWAEWGARGPRGNSLLPSGTRYAKFLSSFKAFLCTPSAEGLVGTRYFECMATRTLVFCPESEYHAGIFRDGYNCVMFQDDLSDFREKLEYILREDTTRQSIVDNAYSDFINNHTYSHRIEKVLGSLKQ